jgi:hypothetical protein
VQINSLDAEGQCYFRTAALLERVVGVSRRELDFSFCVCAPRAWVFFKRVMSTCVKRQMVPVGELIEYCVGYGDFQSSRATPSELLKHTSSMFSLSCFMINLGCVTTASIND